MKPYYEHGGITIYHGDCRDILPTLEAGSVDLVLTDPPYNIGSPQRVLFGNHGKASQRRLVGKDFGEFDRDSIKPPEWIPLIFPALRTDGVVICFYTSLRSYQLLFDEQWEPVQDFHWCKPNPPVPMRSVGFAWAVESGYILRKRGERHRYNVEAGISPNWRILPREPNNELTGHATQKPVKLMKWLVKHWSWFGDTILDPFAGSGTTLVAAKHLGRRATGIELEERWCEVAAKRLQQEILL